MPTYTVHEPPPRQGETAPDPERFVFVRDGFYVWAFLLGPLWMLAHRLWLVLISYLVVSFGFGVVLQRLQTTAGMRLAGMLLLALLVGFEAGTLRRFALRKWKTVGLVVGGDEESAERRFFAGWVAREPVAPVPLTAQRPPSPPVRRGPPSASHVIGLFPEPGGSR